MDCARFERWLDQGRDPALEAAARAHAASCPSCERRWAADSEIERLLETSVARAPAGFTDRVMARVAAPALVPARLPAFALPWWVRAVMEPAAVLAMVLAAILVWRWNALWASVVWAQAEAGARVSAWLLRALPRLEPVPGLDVLSRDHVVTALAVSFACLTLLAAPALARGLARYARPGLRAR